MNTLTDLTGVPFPRLTTQKEDEILDSIISHALRLDVMQHYRALATWEEQAIGRIKGLLLWQALKWFLIGALTMFVLSALWLTP